MTSALNITCPRSEKAATQQLAVLRSKLAKLEQHHARATQACLSLAPEIHTHLPTPGLAGGVLHEIAGESHGDQPAAFGFVLALMAMAEQQGPGPVFLVASRRALSQFGRPYGHGLHQLGLDANGLVLIETRTEKDAPWALEEILRSEVRSSVVAGTIDTPLGLTESRRLNLAAATSGRPLLVLGPAQRTGTSAAVTRWRITAAPAARDRFGALARCRWHVTLDRCRNGRPGEWLIEWDHVAHRFRLAAGMADRPPAAGAILLRAG